ncbi:hypothetical protein BaRGS_00012134 [Batillaria attramentaria]|uniref:Uncharacterized protein n=1 Tax=Batillaria attramentaria TaxID=370345 RepID=A0ABD0LB20_9CAEN
MSKQKEGTPTDAGKRGTEGRNRSSSDRLTSESRSNKSAVEVLSFKPLNIFMQHLEDTAMEIQRVKPGSASLMYDTGIIEDAALAQTVLHANCDLSSVNF